MVLQAQNWIEYNPMNLNRLVMAKNTDKVDLKLDLGIWEKLEIIDQD